MSDPTQPGPGEIEVFYADPVDEDGNKVGTFTITSVTGFQKATVVKVPHDEIVLPDEG